MTLVTETTPKNYLNDMKFNIKTYYLQVIGYNYKFDYMDLNDEQRIRYSMPIVYLMLKNHHYITTKELSNKLKEYLHNNSSETLITAFKEIAKIEVTKINDVYVRKYALTSKQKKILNELNIAEDNINGYIKLINSAQ